MSTNHEPLRFAVVGCGALAMSQHIPNIAHSPNMTLQVCCDVSDDALKQTQEKFGAKRITKDFKDAVNDPEVQAICLATTEKLRVPVIEAAAKAGKPIYVEKPLAKSMQEMYEIQKIVHQAKIPLCVGHNRRSSPAMIDAHRIFRNHMENPQPCAWRWDREGADRPKLAEDGVAGMLVRINDDWHSWKSWVFDKNQAPHGPMLFEMTHFTDLCNWFMAAEPLEVTALDQGVFNSSVIIRYQTGEMATIFMNANGTFGYPKELYEMMGNGAVVAVDHMAEVRTAGIPNAPARTTYPFLRDRHPNVGKQGGIAGWLEKKLAACEEAVSTGDQMKQFSAEPDKGHLQQIERFVNEIRGTGPQVCGVDDAVRATRIAFAAIRSATERRIVKVEEI